MSSSAEMTHVSNLKNNQIALRPTDYVRPFSVAHLPQGKKVRKNETCWKQVPLNVPDQHLNQQLIAMKNLHDWSHAVLQRMIIVFLGLLTLGVFMQSCTHQSHATCSAYNKTEVPVTK
jgi:hypothetical protein